MTNETIEASINEASGSETITPQRRSGTLRADSGTFDDRALHCRAAPAAEVHPDGEAEG